MKMARNGCFVAAILMVAGLCSCDGPDIYNRPDYSAFLDFGQGDNSGATDDGHDTADRDDGHDTGARDTATHHDDSVPADDGTVHEDTNQGIDTTLPPGDKIVFITDREWETKANQIIAGAKKTVDLAHLEFLTYPDDISVAASLKNAQKRGVTVRVMLEGDVDANPGRVDDLKTAGITAKLDSSSRSTHVKIIIVDDNQVLVGSTNLSKSSLHFNHEANVWITDPAVVPTYCDYFDDIWGSPASIARMNASAGSSGILPIGDDEYFDAVQADLQAATSRIWLVMYEYSYSNDSSDDVFKLTQLLTDAAQSGVDVRVFLENSNFSDGVDDHNQEAAGILRTDGVEVRFDSEDVTTHSKLMIIDDTVAVYSGNWGYSGLNNNHEAGAVVNVQSVTAEAVTYFDSLWKTGTQ